MINNHSAFIEKQTSKCVYCGLCSAGCPTYFLSKNETESPRGRVIAMGQVAKNQLKPNPRFLQQMDNCLQCGFCVRVCPQHIPIVDLVSKTKNLYQKKQRAPHLLLVKFLVQHANHFSIGFKLWQLFKYSKKLTLKTKKSFIKNVAGVHDSMIDATKNTTVGLFLGCTGKSIDKQTVSALTNVLTRLQVKSITVKHLVCCGSLHYHDGDFKTYENLENQNINTLKNTTVEKMLYFNSGCTTTMQTLSKKTSIKFLEMMDFLADLDFSKMRFKPLKQTIIVQLPCTHNNQNIKQKITKLLHNIPDLKLEFAPDVCCGAAGLHMFKNPERAKKLRQILINFIDDKTMILSTNIGCRLHLARGSSKKDVKIIHPIVLINQQLL